MDQIRLRLPQLLTHADGMCFTCMENEDFHALISQSSQRHFWSTSAGKTISSITEDIVGATAVVLAMAWCIGDHHSEPLLPGPLQVGGRQQCTCELLGDETTMAETLIQPGFQLLSILVTQFKRQALLRDDGDATQQPTRGDA